MSTSTRRRSARISETTTISTTTTAVAVDGTATVTSEVQKVVKVTKGARRASTKAKPQQKVDDQDEDVDGEEEESKPPAKKAKLDPSPDAVPKRKASKRAAKSSAPPGTAADGDADGSEESKPKKTRAKKKPGAMEEEEYAPRVPSSMCVGAHISAAGGVENAVLNAASIGANAFALFLKSQRKWSSPSLTPESIELFKHRMKKYHYDPGMVLPHGSYLINLGNPDAEKRDKAYECFLDDLQRCEQLGLQLYNFQLRHVTSSSPSLWLTFLPSSPGSTVGGATIEESLGYIADSINRVHRETSYVTVVIENMAGAGNVLGCRFTDLSTIIEKVENKARIGVCLDTCHLFASGYDIRTKETYEATMSEFDSIVGLKYLRAWHLNDSKTPLSSKKDRHENLGLGHIGLATFSFIVNDARLANIPMVLETPSFEQKEVWAKEIGILYEFERRGDAEEKTPDWDAVKGRVQEVVKWAEQEEKKPKKGKTAKRKKGEEEEEDDGDECC